MTRLLIIDDHQDYLRLLMQLLKHEGFEIYGATSPEGAVNRVREVAPDVVLSDLLLSGACTGAELALELRKFAPDFKLVLMTGLTPEAIADYVRDVPDATVIEKTSDLDGMIRRIREAVTLERPTESRA